MNIAVGSGVSKLNPLSGAFKPSAGRTASSGKDKKIKFLPHNDNNVVDKNTRYDTKVRSSICEETDPSKKEYRLALYTLPEHAMLKDVQEHARGLSDIRRKDVEWIIGLVAQEPISKKSLKKQTNNTFAYNNLPNSDDVGYQQDDVLRVLDQYKKDQGLDEFFDMPLTRIHVYSGHNDQNAFHWAQFLHTQGYDKDGLHGRVPVRYYSYVLPEDKQKLDQPDTDTVYKRVKFENIDRSDRTFEYNGRSFVYTQKMPDGKPVFLESSKEGYPSIRLKNTYPLNNTFTEKAHKKLKESSHLQFLRLLFNKHGADITLAGHGEPEDAPDGP